MKERTKNLVVRVDDRELDMAHALAEDRDEPMTQTVRRLLLDAYVARFGLQKPPKHTSRS